MHFSGYLQLKNSPYLTAGSRNKAAPYTIECMLKLIKAWLNFRDKHLSTPGKSSEKPLEGKYYIRSGECTMCGKCCTGINLVHANKTVQTIEEFNQLQTMWDDYKHFKPIGADDDGVIFECIHLQEDNSCGIYDDRPLFCRKYPSETSLLLGGKIPADCGYIFELKKTFGEVLHTTADKPKIKPGKLLSS